MEQQAFRKYVLPVLSGILILGALYMVFLYVPTERTMGNVQRIFYFHLPLAWVAFLAFFMVMVASIAYLRTRNQKWDTLAHTAAEIGVLFASLVLVTGMIWAKPAWGVWWIWEPRLTTTLILWFIYVAYLLIRSFTAEETRGARFAAVLGIIGFVDVPIVYFSISLWRTNHPDIELFSGGLQPPMVATLLVSLAAFTLLYVTLLQNRYALRKAERRLNELKQE